MKILALSVLLLTCCSIKVKAVDKNAAKASAIKLFYEVKTVAPDPAKNILAAVIKTLIENLDDFDENLGSEEASIYLIESILDESADLKISVDLLQNEVKLQALIEYQAELKAAHDNFRQIVLSFGNEANKFREEVNEFIKSYKLQNIENKISNYLNQITIPSNGACPECDGYGSSSPESSLLENFFGDPLLQWNYRKLSLLSRTLINFAIRNRNSSRSLVRSTPNKLIYDFHVAMLMKIYEGNEFLLACYELQNQISKNSYYETNKLYVLSRNTAALEKIVSSMNASLLFVSRQRDLISYNNLYATPIKVEFKNVLQLFVEFLYYLSYFNRNAPFRDIGKIHLTCDDADNLLFDKGDGCHGTVKNCEYTGESCIGTDLHMQSFTTSTDFGVLSDTPDRIYSKVGTQISVLEAKATECHRHGGYNKLDDVCACTCDQFNHPRTERWLYSGVIRAPLGHVITGVRFRKHLKIVYLQIQVGQLMTGAFINASSIRWQEPPPDIDKYFVTFNYGSRRLLLDDLFFDDAVLTGIQFHEYYNRYMFALRIFGRRLVKPALDNLWGDEVVKTVSDKFKFTEVNLESKIPGLKPLVYCDGAANQPWESRTASHTPNGCLVVNWGNAIPTRQNFTLTYGRFNGSLLGSSFTRIGSLRETFVLSSDIFNHTLVKFGSSDRETDIAQTFVPYLDGIDVTFDVKSPLSGIGLMHFTNDAHYAGYIRPFLRSFSYENYLVYYRDFLTIPEDILKLNRKKNRRVYDGRFHDYSSSSKLFVSCFVLNLVAIIIVVV